MAVAKETLHAYLAHLESGSERRRQVNPRKVYPVDTGLIQVYDRTGRANLGHRLEAAAFLELRRRGFEVTYVRTAEGFEVDFLARDFAGREALIQVTAELDDPATREREARALLAAAQEHPRASLHLVTLTPETARGLPEAITVHEAAAWMLAPAEPAEETRRPPSA